MYSIAILNQACKPLAGKLLEIPLPVVCVSPTIQGIYASEAFTDNIDAVWTAD